MKRNYTVGEHEAPMRARSQDSQVGQEQRVKKRRHYRPVATNPWTLASVLCVIVVYIALLEILLSRRQHETATNQSARPVVHEMPQISTTLVVSATRTQLSLTSPGTTGTPHVANSARFASTTSNGAKSPRQLLEISSGVSSTAVCQGTLTYVLGEPSPTPSTGCYQTTETFMPTLDISSEMTITAVSSPTLASQLTLTTTGIGSMASALSESHVEISGPFTKPDYFLSLYLPSLLAVLLHTIWAVVFAATKMMEPFYRLAQPQGVQAKDSILLEYLSSAMSTSTFQDVFSGHWIMLLTSIIYFTTGLLTSFASESMGALPTATCSTTIAVAQPCAPAWIVFLPVTRVLEATLAFLFIVVFLLLILSRKRTSGLHENPTSIRSMANLLGEQEALRDFQSIDPNATKSDVKKVLSSNRYKIGFYEVSLGSHRLGLIKVAQAEQLREPASKHGYTAVDNPSQPSENKSRRRSWSNYLKNGLLLILILTLFSLTLGYYFDSKPDAFNKFFNSSTFGPRFLLSGLAVLISNGWKGIEREARIMEPYRKLWSGQRSGKVTVDTTMTGSPYSTLFIALGRGDFFISWIALLTVLSDVLIIAVAGIPFRPAQIYEAGIASFYISFAIQGLMILGLLAVLMRRRSYPRIPRNPDTLAHVWLYLCASNMVRKGTETHQSDKSQYWFGLSTRPDGKRCWTIDEDQETVAI